MHLARYAEGFVDIDSLFTSSDAAEIDVDSADVRRALQHPFGARVVHPCCVLGGADGDVEFVAEAAIRFDSELVHRML